MNIVCCSERATGCIVDLSMGQFTGTMTPYIFRNWNEFRSVIPGEVVHVHPFPREELGFQLINLTINAHTQPQSPDSDPRRFALRVIQSLSEKKIYCYKCFGVATQKRPLLKCSRCKKALYCSKECQTLHWKEVHKDECVNSFK